MIEELKSRTKNDDFSSELRVVAGAGFGRIRSQCDQDAAFILTRL